VTINGYHFSDDYQDNPVRVGWVDCMVESSSTTEIKCRTMPAYKEEDRSDDFIVFLKTYEEAKCTAEPCTFRWVKSGLPAVTSYATEFDQTLQDYILTV